MINKSMLFIEKSCKNMVKNDTFLSNLKHAVFKVFSHS